MDVHDQSDNQQHYPVKKAQSAAARKALIDHHSDLDATLEYLAQAQRKSLPQVVSDLLGQALGFGPSPSKLDVTELECRNGFTVFAGRNVPPVTVEIVRQICAEEVI